MRSYEEKFVEGAVARGVERTVAERVFSQIVGFSGFGFPKSHSAAFGLLAYQSTWLRVHYGAEFLCSLLNEQPMGFYPPDALVHESQRRGIEVLPPCVARSAAECTVELPAVRLGLGYVNGVREAEVRRLVEERERNGGLARGGGPGLALGRLVPTRSPGWPGRARATRCSRARCWRGGDGRCGCWGWRRRRRDRRRAPSSPCRSRPATRPELRELGLWERMLADYGSTGVTLREHPLELMRPGPRTSGYASSADLERLATAAGSRWPASWWPASGRPPPRASPSCCSRTSTARSTW